MDTFTYIISSFFQPIKSYNVSNKSLFVENDINNNLIEYDFIYSLTHKPYKNKFNILHNKVINNVYIQNQQKEILLDKFYKSQRAYNGFCKLARLYKIKKAKTGMEEIKNLSSIFEAITGHIPSLTEGNMASFKQNLTEAIITELEPVQKKYKELMNDKHELNILLNQGANSARKIAEQNLKEIYKAIGLR